MDKHFLEFWGNFLINTAKGQQQLEDLTKWVRQGFTGFEEMTALFQKVYGLDKVNQVSPLYPQMFNNAQEDFKKSFHDYLNLLGVVPRDEHLELMKKYEELKEKVASQEETIKHLRMLFAETKGMDVGKMTRGVDELVRKQTDQFQKLMESFSKSFKQDSSPTKSEE